MASYIPTTKEILGEHLHYKVSDILRNYFSKEFLHNVPWSPADKITGMLLERSVLKINQMLIDQMFLLENIGESLGQIANEIFVQNLSTIDSKMFLSYTDLGEILYYKIKKFDEHNVSRLTGMLLDLDLKSLVKLLIDDNLLKVAVKKAKGCLISLESSSPHDTETLLEELPLAKCTFTNNETFPVCISLEAEEYRDSLGLYIYCEVLKNHSNSDLASKLTGMLLEMEPSVLQEIVADKKLLQLAIDKAYNALNSSS